MRSEKIHKNSTACGISPAGELPSNLDEFELGYNDDEYTTSAGLRKPPNRVDRVVG
jgi:hypothetical protein